MGFIRLFLALHIIAGHINVPDFILGSEFVLSGAIQSFFIISGFFISYIYIKKYSLRSKSYLVFLANRILRIYPLYWLVLSATIVYFYLSKQPFRVNFISDLTLIIKTDYFNLNPFYQFHYFIDIAWILAVEMIFYILAPLIISRKLFTIFLILIGSVILRWVIIRYCIAHQHAIPQAFFPASLVYFILGICSYKLYLLINWRRVSKRYLYAIFVFVIMFTLSWQKIAVKIEIKEWLYFISLVIFIPPIFILFKNNSVDKFIGQLTYPVFLFHILINQIFGSIFKYSTNDFRRLIAVTFLTVVIAVFLILTVSRPIDKLRKKSLFQPNL